jgi:hypothetical protein
MAYSTNAEVASEFKSIDFAATNAIITAASVDQFIIEADALVNSFVGQRYETPLVSGEGLQLLKMFSRLLVAERIRKILEVKDPKASEQAQNPRGVSLSTKDIMATLKQIAAGEQVLAGAIPLLTGGAFFSNAVVDQDKPIFEKAKDNW